MSGPLRGGSLFTGYGGLDLAVAWTLYDLGINVSFIWDSDIKPAARTLLEYRRPHAPNLGDLTVLDPDAIPGVDLLTFGWPCQPHSSAGKRLGEADPRALWPHVARIIAGLRPTYLFGENVARVAGNGELRRVVRSLAEIGYVGAWRTLRASDVGAPHRRDRLFLFAARADSGGSVADALGQLVRDEPGRRGRPGRESAGVAGDDGPQRSAGHGELRLLKTPTAQLAINGGSQHPDKRKTGGHGPTLADEVEWLLPTPAVADSRNTRNATAGRTPENDRHHSGWTLSDVAHVDRWGLHVDAIARWASETGEAAPNAVMPSPKQDGRPILCPKFVEWMMGLPAGWVTDVPGLTRAQQLSLLGDGVVPQQARRAYHGLITDLAATLGAETAA